ncbi:MAG: septal ring lytic transglycosylase RlpA family protein [Streptosporangiales bacterium]|nr:septal ring lytic transglycosylase RlpA family protein [Streptosporangiales bacterium]
MPFLALALTGLATFGAAAVGTAQAATADHSVSTHAAAPAKVLSDPSAAPEIEARAHGPSTRDLARSELERRKADAPKRAGLASLPSQHDDEYGSRPVVDSGECEASYYNTGSVTANGESFDPSELTAAHKTLPFNTMVRVINKANNESVVVRINDRGPYIAGRCLDLTPPGMEEIAGPGVGTADVRYEVLGKE